MATKTDTNDAATTDPVMAEAGRQGRGDAQAAAPRRDSGAVMESIASHFGPVPKAQVKAVYAEYERQFDLIAKREDLVDAGSEMSFPASDPPSYMAGALSAGGPPPADAPVEKQNTTVSDPSEVKPGKDDGTNAPSGNDAKIAAGKTAAGGGRR